MVRVRLSPDQRSLPQTSKRQRFLRVNRSPIWSAQGGDTGAAGGATVAFIAAELVLNVTPQITPDDRIILDLDVTQDEVGAAPAGGGAPPINTSNLTTKVLVNNGDTIVLGGVFKTSDTNSIQYRRRSLVTCLTWVACSEVPIAPRRRPSY